MCCSLVRHCPPLLLIVIIIVSVPATYGQDSNRIDPVHVVLLAGQSNMAGKGSFSDLSESDQQRVDAVASRVTISINGSPARPLGSLQKKQLKNKAGQQANEKKTGKQSEAKLPKGKVPVPVDRFGPEMFIGVTLAEAHPDQEFLFVKYSRGGTSLYGAWSPQWSLEKSKAVEKGNAKQQAKLYADHVDAIQTNLAVLKTQGRPFKVIGMAWMQGENDAAYEVSALSYQSNLKKLIAAYRTEFHLPELPFVCGQINSNYGKFPAGPDMVRAAFVAVADADPKVAVIRTSKERPPTDFPKVDGAHYNAEGQKRLGTAMARALMEME